MRALGCLAIVAVAGWAAGGRADELAHPLVRLDIDACVGAVPSEVRRIVAVELGALLVEAESAEGVTRARASCHPDGAIELRVDDPLTNKALLRWLNLNEVAASARARLLALAIAELVAASWIELESNPRPAVPSLPLLQALPASMLSVTVNVAPRRPTTRVRLSSLATCLATFAGASPFWGGSLRAGRDEPHHLGWGVDFGGAHGKGASALGSIDADLLDFGAFFYGQRAWAPIVVRGGPGLRGGAVRFAGNADPGRAVGHAFWEPWAGFAGSLGASLMPTRRLAIEAGFELGYVLLGAGARANGVRTAAIAGPWVGAQLGITVFP